MRQGCMLLSVFCLIGIIACSGEEGHDIQIPDPAICTLNYTIPDTEIPDTRASDTGGKISVARPEESAIKDVKLLFFIYDEHGNGLYAGSLDGTVDGNHLAKTGKISVTIPGSGSIDNHTDYDVLVLANASVYFSGMDWDAYCAGQTENAVRVQLRGEMPLHSLTDRTYKVTDDCLPMSGIAFKEAGKDMSVQLLRAAVRIDVRVAEDKKGTVLLKSAVLRNVSPDIPMFNDPQDAAFTPLTYANTKSAQEQFSIIGGLYATEVLRTLHTPYLKQTQAVCLLLECEKSSSSSWSGWYRVNINIDNDVQYLRRNNVYTVIIKDISSQGADTPDDAYGAGSFGGIQTVTVPTDWKVPDGIVTPPDVEVN